jgi:hypothetical protein
MKIKNSNDTIGNRTRNLPACSEMPQQIAPPCVPTVVNNITVMCVCVCLHASGFRIDPLPDSSLSELLSITQEQVRS